MNNEASQPSDKPRNIEFLEIMELIARLKEKIKFDAANRLCIPLFDLIEKLPNEPPSDDTLARLERLAEMQSGGRRKEYAEQLIGAIYQLDLERTQFLVVLTDGTVMKIIFNVNDDPIEISQIRETEFKKIFDNENIRGENLYENIKKDPERALTLDRGRIVYRTDTSELSPEEVKKLVGEDWRKAQEIILELRKRREKNLRTALEILTLPSDDSNIDRTYAP